VKGRVLLDHCVKGSTVHPTTSLAIADMLGGSDQRIDRLLLIWVFAHWCERRARRRGGESRRLEARVVCQDALSGYAISHRVFN